MQVKIIRVLKFRENTIVLGKKITTLLLKELKIEIMYYKYFVHGSLLFNPNFIFSDNIVKKMLQTLKSKNS